MTTTEATLRTRDPFRSLLALSRRGGDVARYRAGTEAAFLINNPAFVKHVLVDNHENYTKGTFINNLFKQAIADGLLTSEGEDWWRQRRLMQPAFYRERVARIGDGVTEATLAMAERWGSNVRTGEPLTCRGDGIAHPSHHDPCTVLGRHQPRGRFPRPTDRRGARLSHLSRHAGVRPRTDGR